MRPKGCRITDRMKRRDLIRELKKMGCVLIRHGAKHDWYHNPNTRVSQPFPAIESLKSLCQAYSQDA